MGRLFGGLARRVCQFNSAVFLFPGFFFFPLPPSTAGRHAWMGVRYIAVAFHGLIFFPFSSPGFSRPNPNGICPTTPPLPRQFFPPCRVPPIASSAWSGRAPVRAGYIAVMPACIRLRMLTMYTSTCIVSTRLSGCVPSGLFLFGSKCPP